MLQLAPLLVSYCKCTSNARLAPLRCVTASSYGPRVSKHDSTDHAVQSRDPRERRNCRRLVEALGSLNPEIATNSRGDVALRPKLPTPHSSRAVDPSRPPLACVWLAVGPPLLSNALTQRDGYMRDAIFGDKRTARECGNSGVMLALNGRTSGLVQQFCSRLCWVAIPVTIFAATVVFPVRWRTVLAGSWCCAAANRPWNTDPRFHVPGRSSRRIRGIEFLGRMIVCFHRATQRTWGRAVGSTSHAVRWRIQREEWSPFRCRGSLSRPNGV